MQPKPVLCCLASGFACLEVVPMLGLLTQAGIRVDFGHVAGLAEGKVVSEYGVGIDAVAPLATLADADYAALVLPGGSQAMPVLQSSLLLYETIAQYQRSGRIIAAIGISPANILLKSALFAEANMTGHPSTMAAVPSQQWQAKRVVWDERFQLLTSQGAGTALDFALKLIERVAGKQVVKQVAAPLILAPGIFDYQNQ